MSELGKAHTFKTIEFRIMRLVVSYCCLLLSWSTSTTNTLVAHAYMCPTSQRVFQKRQLVQPRRTLLRRTHSECMNGVEEHQRNQAQHQKEVDEETEERVEMLAQANDLRRRAQELRASIAQQEQEKNNSNNKNNQTIWQATSLHSVVSPWRVSSSDSTIDGVGYRLHIDIGREEGTWMDPRWGASGRRIPFTLDVLFTNVLVTDMDLLDSKIGNLMHKATIRNPFGSKSSPSYLLKTAPSARLRNGFDAMSCQDGAYQVDLSTDRNGRQQATARFHVCVDGTPERGSSYG